MAFLSSSSVFIAMLCVTIGIPQASSDDGEDDSKLLLIMVDGCRWDYPDKESGDLPGFRKLAENGVRAPYMTPVYPSITYPNWLSVVTGLYPESHGFVANYMYDSDYNDFFLMAPHKSADEKHWWQHAEPLWITAEKHNKSSALFFWDGCQVEIRGEKPSYCERYKYLAWPNVIDITNDTLMKALEWFKKDEMQLVQVYYEPVDYTGHDSGPDSDKRKDALKGIDILLDELQDEMNRTGLLDKVNIVVFSDHGMIFTDRNEINYINLTESLDPSDIRYMIGSGQFSMLLPHQGKVEQVYKALQGISGLNTYKKEDIPERYHLKHSHLTLPLLLVASKNYYIQGLGIPEKDVGTGSYPSLGTHGYDPGDVPEMRGIFFARGPRLRRNHISPPIHMVELYNILCYLLNIEPLPNNGTTSLVKEIKNTERRKSDRKSQVEVHSPDSGCLQLSFEICTSYFLLFTIFLYKYLIIDI